MSRIQHASDHGKPVPATVEPRRALSVGDKLKVVLRYLRCPGLPTAPCGAQFGALNTVEFDHIHALQHGGTNDLDNFRPLCNACHKIKTKQDARDAKHGRRLRGENKPRQKRKLPSRPFERKASS